MAFKHRNRSFRKVLVKLASKVTTHYKKRNPAKAQCGGCGKELHGVPRARIVKMQNLPKTKKRPERPYGGVFCSKCMRETMIARAKAQS
ncbi:MAG: 50S ribosomal protein L34e [bacterium]|nr:50S ribosomal protein L34e [bacterium]